MLKTLLESMHSIFADFLKNILQTSLEIHRSC